MSNLIPLVDLSSNLLRKVRATWFNKRDDEMVNSRRESDPFAERPEVWYQGPLIFPSISEERIEEKGYSVTEKRQDYEEAWSD